MQIETCQRCARQFVVDGLKKGTKTCRSCIADLRIARARPAGNMETKK